MDCHEQSVNVPVQGLHPLEDVVYEDYMAFKVHTDYEGWSADPAAPATHQLEKLWVSVVKMKKMKEKKN